VFVEDHPCLEIFERSIYNFEKLRGKSIISKKLGINLKFMEIYCGHLKILEYGGLLCKI